MTTRVSVRRLPELLAPDGHAPLCLNAPGWQRPLREQMQACAPQLVSRPASVQSAGVCRYRRRSSAEGAIPCCPDAAGSTASPLYAPALLALSQAPRMVVHSCLHWADGELLPRCSRRTSARAGWARSRPGQPGVPADQLRTSSSSQRGLSGGLWSVGDAGSVAQVGAHA